MNKLPPSDPRPIGAVLSEDLARWRVSQRPRVDGAPETVHATADCARCLGLRYVTLDVSLDDPRFGRAVPCHACAHVTAPRRIDRVLTQPGVGALRGRRLETFDGTAHLTGYRRAIMFAARPSGLLTFLGPTGTGKTHLAAGILWAYTEQRGLPLFLTAHDLLARLKATFGVAAEEPGNTATVTGRLATASLLVIDDLGAHLATPWADTEIDSLINARYEAYLPTVVTSNLTLAELAARSPRFASRLRDAAHGSVVIMDGDDRRLRTGRVAAAPSAAVHAFYYRDERMIVCPACRTYPCDDGCDAQPFPDALWLKAARDGLAYEPDPEAAWLAAHPSSLEQYPDSPSAIGWRASHVAGDTTAGTRDNKEVSHGRP